MTFKLTVHLDEGVTKEGAELIRQEMSDEGWEDITYIEIEEDK